MTTVEVIVVEVDITSDDGASFNDEGDCESGDWGGSGSTRVSTQCVVFVITVIVRDKNFNC